MSFIVLAGLDLTEKVQTNINRGDVTLQTSGSTQKEYSPLPPPNGPDIGVRYAHNGIDEPSRMGVNYVCVPALHIMVPRKILLSDETDVIKNIKFLKKDLYQLFNHNFDYDFLNY